MLMYRTQKKVIITPTKCGTCTLQSYFRTGGTDAEADRDIDGWQFHKMRHGPVLPKEVEDERDKWTVYIAVRHPVNRLLSMYQYLKGVPRGWGKMYWHRDSFEEFVEQFFVFREEAGQFDRHTICRAPFIWTNNLSENLTYLGQVALLKVEKFDELGITAHTNRSGHRYDEKATFESLPVELLQKVHDWAMPDINSFGYEIKPWQSQFAK